MESSTIVHPEFDDLVQVCEKEYDPNSSERLCRVELPNNNNIVIRYYEKWTIRDVMKSVLKHKEFQRLYSQRKWIMHSTDHSELFDMHLCLYRLIKPEYETRIDPNVEVDELHKKGIIKNHKHLIFILQDNRMPFNFLRNHHQIKLDLSKIAIDANYNDYAMYSNYLPRVNTLNFIQVHPEVEGYFQRSKHPLNEIRKFELNPLASENEKFDWFIYDDESVHFLMEMNRTKIEVLSRLKFVNNVIYFEDVCEKQNLKDEDLKDFFLNAIIQIRGNEHSAEDNIVSKIMRITTKTTALDVIKSMNRKVQLMNAELKFNPEDKVLKVKSLNDYIFSLDEPLVHFAYLHKCVTQNLVADYLIIDNPIQESKLEENKVECEIFNDVDLENSVINPNLGSFRCHFENLLRIATYNPLKANRQLINSSILIENQEVEYLQLFDEVTQTEQPKEQQTEQQPEQPKEEQPEEDNLFSFMTELMNDLHNEDKTIYETSLNELKVTNNELNNDIGTKRYEEVDIKIINEQLSHMNTSSFSKTPSSFSSTKQPSLISKKKKGAVIPTPNIFLENNKTKMDITPIIETQSSHINMKDIERPFSIMLRNVTLNKQHKSYPYSKNNHLKVLIFKIQIYCGNEPLSKPKKIKWINETQDINALINKRIYFDVDYKTIPNFASIMFKMKLIIYNRSFEIIQNSTIAWANFRLFDFHKRLRSGMHKLDLFDTKCTDNAFYSFAENMDDNAPTLTFEIESFCKPVFNKVVHIKNFTLNVKSLMTSSTDMDKIKEITNKNPFETLNNYDKEVLWTNRYSLAKKPELIPRLLTSFSYNDPKHLIELEKIFGLDLTLAPVQALELLTGNFLHESIRNFAVKSLSKATWVEISKYLYQLVQALKYEMDHNSELAKFLVTMAINHPVTIGHSFFWLLRAEMYNQNYQQRFGIYLEVFLNKIGPTLCKIFNDEDFLIKNLIKITNIQQNPKFKNNSDILFRNTLTAFNQTLKGKGKQISLPLNFKYRVTNLIVDKCGYSINQNDPSVVLTFKNSDNLGDNIMLLFSNGMDLRKEQMTIRLMRAIQSLWFNNKMNLKLSLYGVTITGYNQSMIEIISNCENFENIEMKESSFFSKSSFVKKWIENNTKLIEEEYAKNFMLSAVAYCAIAFVFGMSDRKKKNVLIKTNGEMFYSQFEYFLGHREVPLELEPDTKLQVPFVFPKQFQYVLGGEKGAKFAEFKQKVWEAFMILRKNSHVLITLLRVLLCTGISQIDERSIHFLNDSLALNLSEEEVKTYFYEYMQQSMESIL